MPTGCGQLIGFVGDESDCRTHNLWDADMTNAFGSSWLPGSEPRSSQVDLGDGRGNVPYLAGSPVAGPQTFYGHDNTGNVGPWQRIQYPGSMIGYGDPGIPAIDYLTAYTPVDASNEGIVLDEANPLPAELPRTGSDTDRLAGMGLLLMLLGAMMVAIVSRRREDDDGSESTGG